MSTQGLERARLCVARQDVQVLVRYADTSPWPSVVRCRCATAAWPTTRDGFLGPRARLQGVLWRTTVMYRRPPFQNGVPSMGLHLRNALAKEMVVLGFVFREEFPGVDGGPQKRD